MEGGAEVAGMQLDGNTTGFKDLEDNVTVTAFFLLGSKKVV
jgi:hypothetical protein